MQLFFIDESGTIPPKEKSIDTTCFALGGIIIPEDIWHEVDKELAILKEKYSINGEIKWRYFSPLADLIGGAVYRKFARDDTRFFKMIEPLFRKSDGGKITGYGLIEWPKK